MDREAEETEKTAHAPYIIEKIRRSNLRWREMTLDYVVEAALAYEIECKRTDRGHQGRLLQRERALRAQIIQAYEAMHRHPLPPDFAAENDASETAEPAARDEPALQEALEGESLDVSVRPTFGEVAQHPPPGLSSHTREASTG